MKFMILQNVRLHISQLAYKSLRSKRVSRSQAKVQTVDAS